MTVWLTCCTRTRRPLVGEQQESPLDELHERASAGQESAARPKILGAAVTVDVRADKEAAANRAAMIFIG